MSEEIVLEASMEIIAIASKYIVISVVAIVIGTVGLIFGILTQLVYGKETASRAIFGGYFVGIAFTVIGIFLLFWGLYWMQSEGRRVRKRLEKGKNK